MDSCIQDRHSVDMDISMDIHGKSVDMDMDMDGKFHIDGKLGHHCLLTAVTFFLALICNAVHLP